MFRLNETSSGIISQNLNSVNTLGVCTIGYWAHTDLEIFIKSYRVFVALYRELHNDLRDYKHL